MEGLDIQAILLIGLGALIVALAPVLIKLLVKGVDKILGVVKESETELDNTLVLTLITAAHEEGLVSDALLKKAKAELELPDEPA